MTLRGLFIGIAVCFSAAIFVSSVWGQSQPKRKGTAGYTDYSTPIDYGTSYYDTSAYNEAIKKSLESLKSATERMALQQILAELETKSSREIVALKLASNVCEGIGCGGVSSDTARRYIEAFEAMRKAEDEHQTALRNNYIGVATVSVSLLALLMSALSYRRASRVTRSDISA